MEPRVAEAAGGASRYSLYLLYWYNVQLLMQLAGWYTRAISDAAGRRGHQRRAA
jgi:hypothetical protein